MKTLAAKATILIWFVACSIVCVGGSANAAGATPSGVAATVQNDSAQVYNRPDFDGDIIATLPSGQKVRVSKGTTGDVQKFHKIRVGPRYGYISDMDIAIEGAISVDPRTGRKRKRPKALAQNRKGNKDKAKEKERPKKPIYFSRFIGATVGLVEYKEDISGVNATENLLLYGLKITGPDIFFKGPVLDFNLDLHYGAPSYYSPLSSVKPSGYVLLTDLLLVVPFMQKQNATGLFGFGPLLDYSSFRVFNGGKSADLTMLNMGLSLMLGGAVRFDDFALRLEAKYLVEKISYKYAGLTFMAEF